LFNLTLYAFRSSYNQLTITIDIGIYNMVDNYNGDLCEID